MNFFYLEYEDCLRTPVARHLKVERPWLIEPLTGK
jgi:hypothetical protein